jgi:3-methylcrotonyl-CoA carboxylase alpha subunit
MEMNTRLQVEHPVTEEITGVDLVEWQLRVASGEPLPLRQDELEINGHAIEARLYAEDPAKGFLPSTGRLEYFQLQTGVRVETGYEVGDEVSPFYDSMLAKFVAHGETRDDACSDLNVICRNADVWPVRTNAGFLAALTDEQAFFEGRFDTGYIEANQERLAAKPPLTEEGLDTAAVLVFGSPPTDASLPRSGFRLNATPIRHALLSIDGEPVRVEHWPEPSDQANYFSRAFRSPEGLVKFDQGFAYLIGPYEARGSGHASARDGDILAPMPGKVIAVDVAEGQAVEAGQRLMVLEAMKMEHALTAPFAGTVAELAAREGQQVQVEALLARVKADR